MLLYLDANVFIHAVEGQTRSAEKSYAEDIIRLVSDGSVDGVTSELTLAEVFAPSIRAGWPTGLVQRAYLEVLVWRKKFRLEPLRRLDMYESAEIAGFQKKKVRLPDRLHLATAMRVKATHFITNEKALRVPEPMTKARLNAADIDPLVVEVRS